MPICAERVIEMGRVSRQATLGLGIESITMERDEGQKKIEGFLLIFS
jgi:hypothetical protein